MNQGPGHCGWEAATFLHLPNPLGQPLTQANDRLYIRDPEHEFADRTVGPFEPSVAAPPDAVFTGYSWGTMELWFTESDGDHVLLLRDGVWERWPRARERVGCM